MNRHIFREYDIRGVADRDLPSPVARDIGRALGTFYAARDQKTVALGADCRISSPRLRDEITAGILESGTNVVDLGTVPTPLMYFAVHHCDLDGGVQITGSHNPPEDNGIKMMTGHGSLFGADIQELRSIIERGAYTTAAGGALSHRDVLPAYVGFLRGNLRFARKDLRFAMDAGNGAGGPTAIAAMDAVGLDPIALLCEMDGTFPVHHPDPTEPESLALLRETVLGQNLELGIAFDGDADRIGVIDSRGDILWGDKLMVILSRALLARRPGAAILGEVKCSQTLYDDIADKGGQPILWKTGHSLIKTKMKEEKALLAGEMSGHIFFADRYYGFDDAVYAALRILEILAESDKPLHAMVDDLPPVFATPELRVPCDDAAKFEIVAKVLETFRKTHDVVDVDGARVRFDDGWGLVRASNTQPVLVMRFEATSEEARDAIRAEVEDVVRRVQG